MRFYKNGDASLSVYIANGPSLEVMGHKLTTEEAVEAVCSYLPVAPVKYLSAEEYDQWLKDRDGSKP